MSFRNGRADLAVVAIGRGLSVLGDEVALIALLVWASLSGHGAVAVAALVMAAALPQLVAAPVAGLLVDRTPARRLIATVSLLQAVGCVALVPAVASGSVAAVVGLVALLNLGQAVAGPAWQALVPSLVAADRLTRALATVQTATATAALVGPAVGGLLVGLAGTSVALAVDAVSFALLAVAALAVRRDRRPDPAAGRARGEAMAGVRLIAGDAVLRGVIVVVGSMVLAAGAINVAEVFLITQTLGASATAYGFVGALFAVGLLLGANLARRDRTDVCLARMLVVATVAMAVATVVLGLAPTVAVAALASFGIGVGNGVLNVATQTLVVRRTPRPVLGRVFAALQAVVGAAMLVATALGGVLLTLFDTRAVVVGCGLFAAAVLVTVGTAVLRAVRLASLIEADTTAPALLPNGSLPASGDDHVGVRRGREVSA